MSPTLDPQFLQVVVEQLNSPLERLQHSTASFELAKLPGFSSYIQASFTTWVWKAYLPPSNLRPSKNKKHILYAQPTPPKAADLYPLSGLPHKGPEVLGVSVIMRRTTTSGAPENGRSLKLEAGSIGGWWEILKIATQKENSCHRNKISHGFHLKTSKLHGFSIQN